MSQNSEKSHPVSLFTDKNEVVPWEKASDELKRAYWVSIGAIHLFPKRKREPDMGHGKGDRKFDRGGRKRY